MIDRIGNEANTQALDTIKEQLKAQSTEKSGASNPLFAQASGYTGEDEAAAQASISAEAVDKARADQQVLQFGRSAGRIKDAGEQPEKVSTLKALYNSGNIDTYFNQLDTQKLADSLLNSLSGAYLKQAAA